METKFLAISSILFMGIPALKGLVLRYILLKWLCRTFSFDVFLLNLWLMKSFPVVNLTTYTSLLQVKMRILMGTYALSAGYYDAYYKRAQQVWQWLLSDFYENLYHICFVNPFGHRELFYCSIIKWSAMALEVIWCNCFMKFYLKVVMWSYFSGLNAFVI